MGALELGSSIVGPTDRGENHVEIVRITRLLPTDCGGIEQPVSPAVTVQASTNPPTMMAPTHVTIGLLIAAVVSEVTPFGLAPAVGGLVGSLVPDIDLFVGHHRRTLHFPVLG